MNNFQQMMNLMQFMNQMKNSNPKDLIQSLVASGKVNDDMLQQAHQMAQPLYNAVRGLKR